jgi:1,4-alpha-glucan branching enzyme
MAKSMIRKTNGRQQTFSLDAPEASQVQLVGEFTRWTESPINMEKDLGGIWRATVTLEQGRYSYRFIIDGQWCDDPECAVRESNPYGSENAVRQVS